MGVKNQISIRSVLHAIKKQTGQQVAKSVPSRSAQFFDLCETERVAKEIRLSVSNALEIWKRTWPIMHKFALIQFESGARVSEILRIHSNEISPDGRIQIRASKRGNDKIIRVPELKDWLNSERSKGRYIFQDLNRFTIHRAYVKEGISAYFGQNTNRSTTHLARHLVGLDLNQLKDGTTAIRLGLGHKTDEATDHYKAEIRRKGH